MTRMLYLLTLLLLCLTSCTPPEQHCGEGTQWGKDKCTPLYPQRECGAGTRLENGFCVANDSPVQCGPGTQLQNGACIPTGSTFLKCGPNTEAQGDKCISILRCGPNTTQKDDECIPITKTLTCGPGTKEQNGQCLSNNTPACGPGTKSEQGQCIPDDPEALCGPGRVRIGGTCLTPTSQWLYLPFEKGKRVSVSQGHHGRTSHKGDAHYAVDFPVPEGTTITAARSGIVVGIKSDSSKGCGDDSCSDQANYVYIDHGDGTTARYFHLKYDGVRVKVGQQVCRGQAIGLSGNTGFSTGPHLHLEITTGLNISLPIYFEELRDQNAGVAYHYASITSQNTTQTSCATIRPSPCDIDTFAYRGVLLDNPITCRGIKRGTSYTISGTVSEPNRSGVAFDFKYADDGWKQQCIPVKNGRFSFTWTWPKSKPAGFGYFLLSAAVNNNGNCSNTRGWNNSLRVWANP